ncbi:hypothetical protein EYR40_001361 [Pleurotus pulmonarius]|nr:hypothetical protein EYR36_000295 [Pleurotus pulmonarius]KAF4604178.1 hypothetical protein EYR38_004600 [Pleurotus pulmonarius]KAF4609008.1 hypothetical protein EYR40_001361 [Pleurotus pulmonarius]
MEPSKKRKRDSKADDSNTETRDRTKLRLMAPESKNEAGPSNAAEAQVDSKPKVQRRKLVPSRPFPTVARGDSATGPRSAHKEGKNKICITRKTPLGAYMRRCKDIILKDGYKSLHLSAMGAAIPHLLRLSCALPSILPHAKDEIHTAITTGTVEVQDEITPENEDEDISYETRSKSNLLIVITIGDGENEPTPSAKNAGKRPNNHSKKAKTLKQKQPPQLVFQEPEQ